MKRADCEHCYHRAPDDILSRIDGPARSTFLHRCCRCDERRYLSREINAAGVSWERPERGHVWSAPHTGGGCAECRDCSVV